MKAREVQRPEHTGSAAKYYDVEESSRYHKQNESIQREMATEALHALGLEGTRKVLADLGCGSGLSAAALRQAGHSVVGSDITRSMLQLAARHEGYAGALVLADFGQGMPLRQACLDGAISVSSVQWLCSSADPASSIRRFFSSLHHSLQPGACAALQIYAEDDSQAQQLVAGARAAGLHAGFFVSFPHPNPAKKYSVLLQRPRSLDEQQEGRYLSQHCCNLAWPKSGSCLLAWVRYLQEQQRPTHDLLHAAERLQQEHASLGKRMLRLMRRAEQLTCKADSSTKAVPGHSEASGLDGSSPGSSSNHGDSASSLLLRAEVHARQLELMPCGGTIFVQLVATAADLLTTPGLAACSEWPCSAQQEGSTQAGAAPATGVVAQEHEQHAAAALRAVSQVLIGCSAAGSSSRCEVQLAVLKVATTDEATVYATQQPVQQFTAPSASSTCKAQQFMRLEPLAEVQQELGQQGRQQPAACVLHAVKMSQHLALRFSSTLHPGGSQGSQGSSTSGSTWRIAEIVERVQAFCADMNACVIAVDAQLRQQRLDTTWLLFVAGLQYSDRAALSASVVQHFA